MPEQSTTLRDMIQQALDSGTTLRQLAERAIDPRTGETVSKDTINKIVLGRVARMPIEEHLRGIATALRAPYESVRQAAIAQWLPAADVEADNDEHERLLLLAELKRTRDRADAAIAQLRQEIENDEGGGLRAG